MMTQAIGASLRQDIGFIIRRSASLRSFILALRCQWADKYSLIITLKTAKALGLMVPDKLLSLADEVIE